MSITDGEVFSEVQEDSDLTPDSFRSLFSELIYTSSTQTAESGVAYIFKKANLPVPKAAEEASRLISEPPVNPGGYADWIIQLQGYSESINTLYCIVKSEYNIMKDKIYPNAIKHGSTDKVKATIEAQIAPLGCVKDYLRNLYYNLTRTVSAAQSVLKMETTEARMYDSIHH